MSLFEDCVMRRWENSYLDPDHDLSEPECSCCMCRGEATLSIGGEDYCEDCAKDEFSAYKDDVYCDVCENECPDVYYEVGNEHFCEECFLEVFRI